MLLLNFSTGFNHQQKYIRTNVEELFNENIKLTNIR